MRLYGKSVLKNKIAQEAEDRAETRDAVLWDILPDSRVCRVKVQGSDELIVAHYPENWEAVPVWLKPGNAVRIVHRGGVRGRVEVAGHGQTIPTSVEGTVRPPLATPPNCLVTGGMVVPIPTGPAMMVLVTGGTYRWDGQDHLIPGIKMVEANSLLKMTTGGIMGNVAGIFKVDPVTTAKAFRYDKIVLTAGGVLQYIKGSTFTNVENMPATPDGTLLLNHILVKSGTTSIGFSDIGALWSKSIPAVLETALSKDVLYTTPVMELEATITVKVKDQYNQYMNAPVAGWQITGEIVSGDGTLSAQAGTPGKICTGLMYGDSIVFHYDRGLNGTEGPFIKFTLKHETQAQANTYICIIN